MINNNISPEIEREEMDKKIRKWRRWSKKQPAQGGLSFDDWLRVSPGSNEVVKPYEVHKPNPFRPFGSEDDLG